MFDDVLEFHEKFGHPIGVPLSVPQMRLRKNLIEEECIEVVEELWPVQAFYNTYSMLPDEHVVAAVDKIKLTKELCDLLYVVLGTGVTFGLPLEKAFKEVHRSNMSKLGEDGKPILREDGKVLKSPNYTPANLEKLF